VTGMQSHTGGFRSTEVTAPAAAASRLTGLNLSSIAAKYLWKHESHARG
jgi:hypothetical protein